ncbi:MAG: DUF805 domain-containing protein [Candidatus Gracilibacteria bacterium]|nr:DUF805 domain-containing protein [Candidatus Gracilibacteria bacterium]
MPIFKNYPRLQIIGKALLQLLLFFVIGMAGYVASDAKLPWLYFILYGSSIVVLTFSVKTFLRLVLPDNENIENRSSGVKRKYDNNSISLIVMEGLFDPSGRLTRLPYFFMIFIIYPLGLTSFLFFIFNDEKSVMAGFFAIVGLWINFSLIFRRLHDIGVGGIKYISLVLLALILPVIQFALALWESDPNENKWGLPIVKSSKKLKNKEESNQFFV